MDSRIKLVSDIKVEVILDETVGELEESGSSLEIVNNEIKENYNQYLEDIANDLDCRVGEIKHFKLKFVKEDE